MAPHSSTLAWRIPGTEEPGRLQSMGSLRVGHDWETSLSLSCIGEGNGTPLQCSCLENPRDGGAWWATIYGVTQSRTQLKWQRSVRINSFMRNYFCFWFAFMLVLLARVNKDKKMYSTYIKNEGRLSGHQSTQSETTARTTKTDH